MSKLEPNEIASAKIAAQTAKEADRRNDVVARDAAIIQLFVSVGYWRTSRSMTTAEFRGERVPPKMLLRMPTGRSLPWSRRWDAVEAWAQS